MITPSSSVEFEYTSNHFNSVSTNRKRMLKVGRFARTISKRNVFFVTKFRYEPEEEVELAQMYFDEARRFARDGSADAAIYNCKKSLDKSKKSLLGQTVFAYLGQLYVNKGDLNKALLIFNEARELHPDHDQFSLMLGGTLFRMGQVQTAFQILENLYKKNPNVPTLRYQLGCIYGNRKQLFEARQLLEESIEHEPQCDPIRIRVMLSHVYKHLGDFVKSEKMMIEARAMDAKKADTASKEISSQMPK
jgi:predicted Zn-dependent protease